MYTVVILAIATHWSGNSLAHALKHSVIGIEEDVDLCTELAKPVQYPTLALAAHSPARVCRVTSAGSAVLDAVGDGRPVGPELVFWHLEKGGGETVINAIKQYTRAKFTIVTEKGTFSDRSIFSRNTFRIGLIREPCSWYQSLYYWGHPSNDPYDPSVHIPGRYHWLAKHLRNQGLMERFYGNGTDAGHSTAKFRDFVHFINGPDRPGGQCGVLSMRFWSQVIHPQALVDINRFFGTEGTEDCGSMKPCPCPLGNFVAGTPDSFHRECSKSIDEADLSTFDCWLRTDHLSEDYEQCMTKYESRGGTWYGQGQGLANNTVHENKHPPCADDYDEVTAAFVEDRDGALARRFGYSGKCCEKSTQHAMPSFP